MRHKAGGNDIFFLRSPASGLPSITTIPVSIIVTIDRVVLVMFDILHNLVIRLPLVITVVPIR
jgi:hypothetical protein